MVNKYNFRGLSDADVLRAREQHGANELPPVKVESFWEKLVDNFQDPLIKILMLALVITLLLAFLGYAEWFEGVGIASAVFLATFVSTYSEFKNESSFQTLQLKASMIKSNVFRNGNHVASIYARDIVVGDYVLLQAGDKIPADGRLVVGELDVNQSTLNGEPEPKKKSVAPRGYVPKDKADFLDDFLCFRGSVVENGEGVLLVDGVGSHTFYGQLAIELSKTDERESPLQVKLSALADNISNFGYVGSAGIALSFLFKQFVLDHHWNWVEMVNYITQWQLALKDVVTSIILAIIVIVVAVPEGLPMMIAIVLSLNMRKLLKAKVLVRKLLGIETAGSIDILFVDKTGTLTKGAFTPRVFVSGLGLSFQGYAEIPLPLRQVLAFAIRESTSAVISDVGEIAGGNASDRALLDFLDKPSLVERTGSQVLRDILFNSVRKFSGTTLRVPREAKVPVVFHTLVHQSAPHIDISAIKGAPEIIIPRCTHAFTDRGEIEKLTTIEPLLAEVNRLSQLGIRVISVAMSTEQLRDEELPAHLVLVGVVGVLDEIRPESKAALKVAFEAGIQVVMITGDKKETAIAVAEQIGLIGPGDAAVPGVVVTSADLQRISNEQLAMMVPAMRIIARALPTDKSRFIRVAQSLSKVVGMTGDGVNDSAALKQADVGFAMGSGSEVAKEAADIVILDDNFASITQAVLYGRTIYKSIQKFIVFQSTINVASMTLVFLGPFMGFDFPLTLIQLLWVNLVMDTLAALAFGGEPALQRYMRETPIKREANIITGRMWFSILAGGFFIAAMSVVFLTYDPVEFYFMRDGKFSEDVFLTAFFAFFIFMAVINAFNVRTSRLNLLDGLFNNIGFILVVSFIFFVQILFTYIGGRVLRTVGLTVDEWMVVIKWAVVIIPFDLFRKLIYYLLASKSTPKAKRD